MISMCKELRHLQYNNFVTPKSDFESRLQQDIYSLHCHVQNGYDTQPQPAP